MHMFSSLLSRRCARTVRHGAVLGLLWFTLLWSVSVNAAVSTFCPAQNLTVANGGSVVSANLAACDGPLNIGMAPGTPVPTHGTILVSPQTGPGDQTVTYSHNGNSATSDTFVLEDENGDTLTFSISNRPGWPTSS